MTRSEVAELVAMLIAAYPRAHINEATSRIYEADLIDLDADMAHRAVVKLRRSSKWFPTIAEIREAAHDIASPNQSTALEAWGKVCSAAERRGSHWSPRFRCAITQRCVEAMGWRYICRSGNDAADRARFVQLYDELGRRERLAKVVALPLSVPGLAMIGNGGDA